MENLLSTFNINVPLLLAQIVNFAIVFGVLYWFAMKPLSKLMQKRSQTIARGLENTRITNEIRENAQIEFDQQVGEARQVANTILQDARKQAELKRLAILEKADQDKEVVLARGREQLERERKEMITTFKHYVAQFVTQSTERILGSEATKQISEQVVKDDIQNNYG